MTDWPLIDAAFPYRGRCMVCGCADARHRLFDAMRGNYRAGDTVERIAVMYDADVEAVRAVVEARRCPLRRRERGK